ncbi:MAG TPA: LysM domain-containing protein [Verrucomicrobiae bacterium]|nr:LysM domain-containing protein [Verrucomicrobiae bacterium]
MKRAFYAWLAAACLGGSLLPAVAADPPDDAARAAAVAAQQEAEERYRRLNTSVEELLASQSVLQKRIAALQEELRRVKEEAASKPTPDFATREDLKRLAEQLQAIDKKRQDDKELILGEIRKLAQTPVTVPEAPRQTSKPKPANLETNDKPPKGSSSIKDDEPKTTTMKGVNYKVESKGETLSLIASEHNKLFKEDGLKTSVKLILDANPDLDARKIYVGKTIFVPLVPIKP